MSEGYESVTDDILTDFITTLKGTTTFSSQNISYAYRKRISTYPYCRIRLIRDRLTTLGPKETQHDVGFEVQVHHRGQGAEEDQDIIIGYVGEIVDAIEDDRMIGTALTDVNAEVRGIEYSFRAGDRDAVFYYAYMTVNVRHLRNV